jgi:uncharacterized small protein (DUF1192 family)
MHRAYEEIQESVDSLINEAEMVSQLLVKQESQKAGDLSHAELPENQIALIADEIKRFRAEFDRHVDDDIVEKALINTLRPAVERWLEANMSSITREVVSQKLDDIARESLTK